MSKHTPGPWNYDSGYINTHRVDDDGSRDYVILAEMHSTFGPDNYGVDQWMLPRDECEANARLLAAAPEMYELLANLAAVCDRWDEDYENDEQRADAFWHMARIAKVLLLDKIEGGEE